MAGWLAPRYQMSVEPLAVAGVVAVGRPADGFNLPRLRGADRSGSSERPGGVALVACRRHRFPRQRPLSRLASIRLRERSWKRGSRRSRLASSATSCRAGTFTRTWWSMATSRFPSRRWQRTSSRYDLTFANLEGNLSNTLPQPVDPHSFTFVSSPAMLDGFKLAGIDVVTLANNHSVWNSEGWGVQGLLDTIDALDNAGLPYFGAGRTLDEARAPWLTTIKGKTIALLGIDGVTANHEVQSGRETGVVDYGCRARPPTAPGTNPYVTHPVPG